MKAQFSFVYNRKKTAKKPSQKGLIELRAYLNPNAKYFSTKIEIKPGEWNAIKQEINSRHPDAESYNRRLRKLKSGIEHLQDEYHFKGKPFTLENVKDHFKSKRLKTSSFIDFVKSELEADKVLKQKTKIQHRNTINKLFEFNNKDVLFTDINYTLIDSFINYLRSKKLAPNTVQKNHKSLKKFIDIAIKRGHIEITNPCKELKVRGEEKPRDVLSMKELLNIEQLIFEDYDNKINQVRDMFLFACYTGLRISDVCGLKTEYVKHTEKGPELDFYTIKVNKHATLPLYSLFPVPNHSSKPVQIVTKYYIPGETFIFPKLSEAYINRHLKLIAEMAGIDFNLTFHIGRETFGTYMASKVPLPVLRNLLQHSDIKTTMRYVHLNEQMIKEQLIKVEWD